MKKILNFLLGVIMLIVFILGFLINGLPLLIFLLFLILLIDIEEYFKK